MLSAIRISVTMGFRNVRKRNLSRSMKTLRPDVARACRMVTLGVTVLTKTLRIAIRVLVSLLLQQGWARIVCVELLRKALSELKQSIEWRKANILRLIQKLILKRIQFYIE